MKYWFALILIAASSCAPNLTFDYDVFNEQAVPSVDEAPHPNNSLEWWYYTGLLKDTATMESFGVEFVVFHFNINGKKERLMTNVALTDVSNNEFHYSHTLGKLEDKIEATLPLNFEVKEKGKSVQLTGGLGNYTLATTAKNKDNDFGYKLNLNTQKEVLLHGDGTGYENYGDWAKAGYYSYTDLETIGTIWLNGKEHAVKGKMWYDRQWNCANVLSMRNAGWDWMSITLNETKEQLMLYRLRVNAEEHVYGGT